MPADHQSLPWRLGTPHQGWWGGVLTTRVDIREDHPDGGSRFVAEVTPEDAARILEALAEVPKLRAALESIAVHSTDDVDGYGNSYRMRDIAIDALADRP